jgi:hypothetical protein
MRVALLIAGFIAMATPDVAAHAAADPAPPVATTSDALTRWVAANIESSGWAVADVSSSEALLIQTGLKPPGANRLARAYVRWERFPRSSADHPWRSALHLLEIECGAGRFRELSWAAYTGSNFSGVMIENQPSVEGDWRVAAEGSIMLAAIARACPGAVERKPIPVQGENGASVPSR